MDPCVDVGCCRARYQQSGLLGPWVLTTLTTLAGAARPGARPAAAPQLVPGGGGQVGTMGHSHRVHRALAMPWPVTGPAAGYVLILACGGTQKGAQAGLLGPATHAKVSLMVLDSGRDLGGRVWWFCGWLGWWLGYCCKVDGVYRVG